MKGRYEHPFGFSCEDADDRISDLQAALAVLERDNQTLRDALGMTGTPSERAGVERVSSPAAGAAAPATRSLGVSLAEETLRDALAGLLDAIGEWFAGDIPGALRQHHAFIVALDALASLSGPQPAYTAHRREAHG